MQIIINQLVKNVFNTTLYAVKKFLSTVPGLNAFAFCVFALILGLISCVCVLRANIEINAWFLEPEFCGQGALRWPKFKIFRACGACRHRRQIIQFGI